MIRIIILISFITIQLQSQEVKVTKKSPTNAMLYSIVPGGGQIYNEQYWKAGIVIGGLSGLGTSVIYWNNKFNDTKLRINALGEDPDEAELDLLKRRREFYRDYRDQMAVYFFAFYMASIIDAYVGAQLYEFETGEDLSLNFGVIRPGFNGVSLKLRF